MVERVELLCVPPMAEHDSAGWVNPCPAAGEVRGPEAEEKEKQREREGERAKGVSRVELEAKGGGTRRLQVPSKGTRG